MQSCISLTTVLFLHVFIYMKDYLSHSGLFFHSSLILMIVYFYHILCDLPKANLCVVFGFPFPWVSNIYLQTLKNAVTFPRIFFSWVIPYSSKDFTQCSPIPLTLLFMLFCHKGWVWIIFWYLSKVKYFYRLLRGLQLLPVCHL